MKKIFQTLACLALPLASASFTHGQTATDFNGLDCNGVSRHLFADLDAGKAVILEFFMNACSPCINAGDNLEALKTDLLAEYPGMVMSYATPYNNSTSCTTVNSWVTTNGFTSIPMDSGATQVAYYGGFGMPTVVVVAGADHAVLNTFVGWSSSDTTAIGVSIRNFLSGATGIPEGSGITHVAVGAVPADQQLEVAVDLAAPTQVGLELLTVEGRSVLTQQPALAHGAWKSTLEVGSLPSGCYLLSIATPAGKVSRKVLIQH